MATQGESKEYPSDSGDPSREPIERSLQDAMDNDPRLGSGLGGVQPDNVLDFIQMTGLTTRPQRDAWDPPVGEGPDDPVSFFEYGVRDVDGSADPDQISDPSLDVDAFRAPELQRSETLEELKQIIADLAPRQETAPAASESEPTETLTGEPTPEPLEADPEPEIDAPVLGSPDEQYEALKSAPNGPSSDTSTPSATSDLKAARDLLDELTQANQAAARTERQVIPPGAPTPVEESPLPASNTSNTEPVEETTTAVDLPRPSMVGDYEPVDDPTPLPHGLPERRRHQTSLGGWLLRFFLLLGGAAAVWGVVYLYSQQIRTPTSAFASAERLLEAGKHEQAARAFIGFAERNPSHPARADALFNAAAALHATPPHPEAKARERYEQAITLLQQFTTDYPAHEKVARAQTLTGILNHRLGQHDAAINILGDPDLRLRDPAAYVTALRTLGRSYAEMSQIDNARTAFMRAAALPENLAPDQDYVELADLYQRIAERSGDPARRAEYMERAIEQWNFALQVPGLLRSRKEDIKLLRDVAVSKLRGPGEAASVGVSRPGAPAGTRIRTINRGNEQGDPGARISDSGESNDG